MVKKFVRRALSAVVIYAAVVWVLASVHDYPQFLGQLHQFRLGGEIAARRPWLNLFYFINEAGSGIKFLLTGNERHMRFYPSPGHLFASRLARAAGGDWRMQYDVGRMYFVGQGTEIDRREGMFWLRLALDNAPPAHHAKLSTLVAEAEDIMAAGDAGDAGGKTDGGAAGVKKNN